MARVVSRCRMLRLCKFCLDTPVVQVLVVGTVSPWRFVEMQVPRMVLVLPESEGNMQTVSLVTRRHVNI